MRPTAKESFLRQAYRHTKIHGPKTVRELISELRTNPLTGRANANLPTVRSAAQHLSRDNRFDVITCVVSSVTDSGYVTNQYMAVIE